MARKPRLIPLEEVEEIPITEQFLKHLQEGILSYSKSHEHNPSNWYKPSSLNCLRQMYYMRKGYEQEELEESYNGIGMADTGTRRHESIQEVLLWLNTQPDCKFIYVDVEDYISKKHEEGKLLHIEVQGKKGAETLLVDHQLNTRFMCDGLIYCVEQDLYSIFEFKNQISFKYKNKKYVDTEHEFQVTSYCTSLDTKDAFVLYENRDTCLLNIPEHFKATKKRKETLQKRIELCEECVSNNTVPDAEETKHCKWCRYKNQCKKDDN